MTVPTDTTPTTAGPCGASKPDADDLWWTCKRTAGHLGAHADGNRTWHDVPAMDAS